ncbi:hypothetical protein [Neolewinella antarctica]|uniref:DoxX family protein n=1 Tax=Neolewinella antarctica TaxID=442734 RepID=A0ABX0XE06_9BACT|nr:hypothetical protein [Neolewinella antarctica]NJC27535.1 hypothetical protein [Neolewinella antarctica]
MILLLHTLIEGVIALLFMFYPQAGDLVPGFGTSEGASFELLMRMYGWAAALLAALSLIAYYSRANRPIFLTITGLLSVFHIGMAIIQGLHNPDARAMLLHFLLAIFMGGQYVNVRRQAWSEKSVG